MKSSDPVAVASEATAPCADQASVAPENPPQRMLSACIVNPGRQGVSLRCDGLAMTAAASSTTPGAVATAGDGRECCGLANMRIRKLSRSSTPSLLGKLPESIGAASDWNDEYQGLRKKPRQRRSISCPTRSRKAAKFESETDNTTTTRCAVFCCTHFKIESHLCESRVRSNDAGLQLHYRQSS